MAAVTATFCRVHVNTQAFTSLRVNADDDVANIKVDLLRRVLCRKQTFVSSLIGAVAAMNFCLLEDRDSIERSSE
jgi:hypothetical protein